MILLYAVSKRLAKTSYKDVYISAIGSKNYTSKMLQKEGKIGGVVPSLSYSEKLIDYTYKVLRNKIQKNESLDTIEKMFYESYGVFKANYIKNTAKFDEVLYIDNYCRVIFIAKAVIKNTNAKIDYKSLDNFFNNYFIDTPLSYKEINILIDALKYQLIVETKNLSKYILHYVKMKKQAQKSRFISKNIDSVVYCYFRGGFSDNFEEFENIIQEKYRDYYQLTTKFHDTNNAKINRLYNIVFSLKYLETNYLNPLNYYDVYNILKNDFKFYYYPNETKNYVMEKLSNIATSVQVSESDVAVALIDYSKQKSIDILTAINIFGKDIVKQLKRDKKNDKKAKGYLADKKKR